MNKKLAFTPDQLVAVKSTKCDGCVFDSLEYGCQRELSQEPLFPCLSHRQKDGQSVIWILKDQEQPIPETPQKIYTKETVYTFHYLGLSVKDEQEAEFINANFEVIKELYDGSSMALLDIIRLLQKVKPAA